MNRISIFLLAAGLTGLGFVAKKSGQHNTGPGPGIYPPVVILELFTSEGCSSCPPADQLLADIASKNPSVIALSMHVDYWNRLGWKDPFSDVSYSDRQKNYRDQFGLQSIYTPQLVINGTQEGVGSNRNYVEKAVKESLSENALVKLSVSGFNKNKNAISFNADATGNYSNANIYAVLVQKTATSHVKGGENRGAIISHINIVRDLMKQDAVSKAPFKMNIPADIAAGNWRVVLFTQEKNSGKITGAAVYNPIY